MLGAELTLWSVATRHRRLSEPATASLLPSQVTCSKEEASVARPARARLG
jgi:hypothetical protein